MRGGGINMKRVVILSGSPSAQSRSDILLSYLGKQLQARDVTVTHISVKDIPEQVLCQGDYTSPVIQQITQRIEEAQGLIVGSPVYKASYSGVFKSLVDLLPQDIFKHKPVLPIMTGGSLTHLLAIEYTLKPLVNILKGKSLKGIYFLDSQLDKNNQQPILDDELLARTKKQLDYFFELIHQQQSAASLSS